MTLGYDVNRHRNSIPPLVVLHFALGILRVSAKSFAGLHKHVAAEETSQFATNGRDG
jgi:hypothetical protein